MVSFGAVVLEDGLERTFYGETAPISETWVPEALAVSGVTRDQHLAFRDPETTMRAFDAWCREVSPQRVIAVSDNPAYDFSWLSFYLWKFTGGCVLGHSARRIPDLYGGFLRDAGRGREFRKLRQTSHTHNPVDDAKGNAEALLAMARLGIRGIPTRRRS